ncbi:hypothetical protein ABW20_dc0108264 [Dactylellina cionopaga]|nr:hypothetical protein ABW20_dc0108264 [Dactylellina cionopaga]
MSDRDITKTTASTGSSKSAETDEGSKATAPMESSKTAGPAESSKTPTSMEGSKVSAPAEGSKSAVSIDDSKFPADLSKNIAPPPVTPSKPAETPKSAEIPKPPTEGGSTGLEKIALKKLKRPYTEVKNASLKTLQASQEEKDKAFNIQNIAAGLFMRYVEDETLELAEEAFSDNRGIFFGKLGGSNSLTKWLEVIQPPIQLILQGGIRPSKNLDDPLEVDLIGFMSAAPLGSKGKGLKFTTHATVLKEQFGDACENKDGLYASPGHILLGLVTAQEKDATIGLSDLLELSGISPPSWIRSVLDVVEAVPEAGKASRSGLWIMCGVRFDTFLRVQMQLRKSTDKTGINAFIDKYVPSLKLDGINVIVKKGFRQATSYGDEIECARTSEVWLQAPVMGMDGAEGKANGAVLSIGIGITGLRLSLQWTQEGSSITNILAWISSRIKYLSGNDGAVPELTNMIEECFSAVPSGKSSWLNCFHMRGIGIDFAEKEIYGASFMMEVDLPFGAPKGKFNTIVLSARMEDEVFTFTGMLLGEKAVAVQESKYYKALLDPNYETFTSLAPFPPRPGCEKAIKLKYLDPDNPLENIPKWLPDEIPDLYLQLEFAPEGTTINFGATFKVTDKIGGDVPVFQLNELVLAVEIYKPKAGTKEFNLSFSGKVNMFEYGAEAGDPPCGELSVSLQYQTPGIWYLRGGIEGLEMKALASFFDGDAADVIMDIFENFYLHELFIEYSFSSGTPSALAVNAIITIANVDFSLTYKHYGKSKTSVKEPGTAKKGDSTQQKAGKTEDDPEKGKVSWLITAEAQPADPEAIKNPKIRDWIADIVDEDLASDLPEFVGNTEIPLDTLAASLKCFSVDGYTMFAFRLSIKGFGFEYAQIQQNADSASTQASGAGKSTQPVKKPAIRLLRIKLDAFPDCGTLPLVGEVKQPLEEIDFLWVSAPLTRGNADLLNEYIFTAEDDKLNWKEPTATGGSPEKDIVIETGFHFMVIMSLGSGPTVILDYIFGQSGKSKASKAVTGGKGTDSASSKAVEKSSQSAAVPTPASGGSDESKPSPPAPFEKKVGPLAISKLGLKYKEQILTVVFDADVKLGPLEFALKGFGVELHLKGVSLHDLSKLHISANLSGLGMQVAQGDITLAGLFERVQEPGTTGYVGGLSICLPQYTFLGAGGYLEASDGYKSVFGILMVTGPLMHFGFAEVRGITGGFGYNSTLRIPTLADLDRFPLLNGSLPGGQGPLKQLENITRGGWITPKKDTIWIAAGLTVRAFQVVDVQAVVTVEVGDDLKIAIVGRAIATAPPLAKPDKAFVLVVLDVVASLDFGKGAFSLQGQLNPSSFILDKDCHPTGGFALCSWFGKSQYAGDWVFTIGGFHPAYAIPAHYPNPPRLGISWKYDRSISITGEAYFAITPRLCMGGGKLSINFDVGNISAYLTAYADFLINYEPFQYLICVGVKIGVSYTLKIWFIRKKFSIDISAQITIEGPPVSGKVYVNLKVISFTISFGARRTKKDELKLEQFWELLVQSGTEKEKTDHIFGVAAGLIPTKDAEKEDKKQLGSLRAGVLEIQVHSRAAISQVKLGKSTEKSRLADQIYAKPTRSNGNITSDIYATVIRQGVNESDSFRIEPIYKHVPSALWTRYNPADDPSDDRTNTAALRSTTKPTYEHLMGFSIKPCAPKLSPDKLPKFSVDSLLEASGAGSAKIELSQKTPEKFLPGTKATTKAKMRGVWGGNTTTTPINLNKVLKAFGKGLDAITCKQSRYANLPTAAPKQVFEDFDLIYSAGAPRLASSADNKPPDMVAGEWSTKWEKSSTYKISLLNRSSIDLEKYANGIINERPSLHFGINRIDYQKSPNYRFRTSVTFREYAKRTHKEQPDGEGRENNGKVITISASSCPGSVLNECDLSWLAVFDKDLERKGPIQTGAPGVASPSLGSVNSENMRTVTRDITFKSPYQKLPKVVVWLTFVSASGSGNPIFKVEATDIKEATCKIKFTIWGEGGLEGMECSWLAHPKTSRRIQSGVFSTGDLRSPFSPRKITSDRVNFELSNSQPFKFERTPTLLVAFNHIECSCHHDFRAGVTVSDVKKNGFTWHCSTWGFTNLHMASGAYVAFDA